MSCACMNASGSNGVGDLLREDFNGAGELISDLDACRMSPWRPLIPEATT